MDSINIIGMVSVITAGLTTAIGSIGPSLGEGRAVAQALVWRRPWALLLNSLTKRTASPEPYLWDWP